MRAIRSNRPHARNAASAAITTALLAALGCAGDMPKVTPEGREAERSVVLLPLGEDGVHYLGHERDEQEAWGPNALRVAIDGSFFVADSAGGRLLQVREGGRPAFRLPLGPQVRAVRDVLVRERDLYVLDTAAMQPHVVRYSLRGQLLDDYPLPAALEGLVDGFLDDAEGRVLLQGGGVAVSALVDGAFAPRLTRYAHAGHTFDLRFPDAQSPHAIGHALAIQTPRGALQLRTQRFVAAVRLLRALPDGRSFWSLEEVGFEPTVLVDAIALQLDAQGRVIGRARLPVADQHLFVEHVAAVDAQGRLFALRTQRNGAEIVELAWQGALSDVLDERTAAAWAARPEAAEPQGAAGSAARAPTGQEEASVGVTAEPLTGCRARQLMIDTGFAYVNSASWLAPRNLDRPAARCEGRGLPRYFAAKAKSLETNAGARCEGPAPGPDHECIRSVPYDWGGAESVESYRAALAKGFAAGDIDTHNPVDPAGKRDGIETCSRGIDCSGFVTQAWDLRALHGIPRTTTKGLPSYSAALSRGDRSHPGCRPGARMPQAGAPQAAETTSACLNAAVSLAAGDILLRTGKHVTLFRAFGAAQDDNVDLAQITGRFPFHFEATQSRGYDRVSYDHWPWSRFDQYEPRRSNDVCP